LRNLVKSARSPGEAILYDFSKDVPGLLEEMIHPQETKTNGTWQK